MLAWLQQSSFIVLSFLLIPLLVYVLYTQAIAISRLDAYGVKAHPAIKESIGIGNGAGNDPTWLFKLESTEEDALQFYGKASNTEAWKLVDANDLFLTFKQGEKNMTIAAHGSPGKKTLTIMIKRESR